MIRLSDSIGLPAIILFGQISLMRDFGLPKDPVAARVTIGWMVFFFVCLIHAIWLRKREKVAPAKSDSP